MTSWGKGWKLVNRDNRCLLCVVNLWHGKWALLYLTLLHVDFTLKSCMQIKSKMPQSCLCTNSLVLFFPTVLKITRMEHFIMSKFFLCYIRSFKIRKGLKQKLRARLLFCLSLPLDFLHLHYLVPSEGMGNCCRNLLTLNVFSSWANFWLLIRPNW